MNLTSMSASRPVQLTPHEVLIDAPRELAFQVMTAFGRGRIQGMNERSNVLERDGNRLVVEFVTDAVVRKYTTVEEVVLHPPERIDFKHLTGPFQEASEVFTFTETPDGKTVLRHTGEFVLGWPLVGRAVGSSVTKRWFERVMKRHMAQMKEAIEARAARSHVFRRNRPAAPAGPDDSASG